MKPVNENNKASIIYIYTKYRHQKFTLIIYVLIVLTNR